MNLRDLEYVIAVAELKSFTRAAERVAISQPTLSNQIKKLENNFQMQIFERRNGTVRLTKFGQEFVAIAKRIDDSVCDISRLVQSLQGSKVRPARIGTTPTLAAYLTRYLRNTFRRVCKNLQIVIVEEYPTTLAKMVKSREIEMALIARKSYQDIFSKDTESVGFAPLWREALYLGVRKGHPLTKNKYITAHEVPQANLLRFDIPFGFELEANLPKSSKDAGAQAGIDIRSARFETVCRHVAQSDACTIVNSIAAEQFKKDGFGLDFIPFEGLGNTRELGAITHPKYPHMDIVERFQAEVWAAPPTGAFVPETKFLQQPLQCVKRDTS
ncbi:LysR family transcriptional regulator [Ruegeria atlantica]|uniref:LysR family transcriptional regulator n=1 Tax=Ruegeria atlantica TaxID=81569 RepID=UPI00147AC04E|nr:LysR family transcriptional regulator [Ruegeria atlantica]